MLNDMTVAEFTGLLATDAPAPGGGSAAALMGALGVSLTSMVAALTVNKEKYAAYQTQMEQTIQEADALRNELIDLMDKDAHAFNQVMAAYALPKGSEEEIQARKAAIQAALCICTEIPYKMMCASMQALHLTQKALEGYNANAASDLGVAAVALGAAMRGAWLNILANLGGISDTDFTARFRAEGEALLAEALPLSESVYQTIVGSL